MVSKDLEYESPIYEWKSVMGPSGATFYSGNNFKDFENNLFVGIWNLGMLRMITLGENFETVESDKVVFAGYKPVMAVTEGPDGFIYFSTTDSIERIIDVESDSLTKAATSFPQSISLAIILIIIIVLLGLFFVLKIKKLKIRKQN